MSYHHTQTALKNTKHMSATCGNMRVICHLTITISLEAFELPQYLYVDLLLPRWYTSTVVPRYKHILEERRIHAQNVVHPSSEARGRIFPPHLREFLADLHWELPKHLPLGREPPTDHGSFRQAAASTKLWIPTTRSNHLLSITPHPSYLPERSIHPLLWSCLRPSERFRCQR